MGLYITALLLCGVALADPPPRSVQVIGRGNVSAMPDKALVGLGVEARNPVLDEARAEVSATVGRVLALCKDLGIDAKQVDATGVRIQPEYTWLEQERKRQLQGYVVSRQVNVELRDLEKLGALLERAVDAGVNQVSEPVLNATRRAEFEREAMSKAVADARLNAETLARAAGARLGAVRRLDVTGGAPMPMMGAAPRYAAAEAAVSAESGYQPGELRFMATVTAEYDLEP
jgi:uncharacterized protein YggE